MSEKASGAHPLRLDGRLHFAMRGRPITILCGCNGSVGVLPVTDLGGLLPLVILLKQQPGTYVRQS